MFAGKNSTVGEGAVVRDSVLWDNVAVEGGALVSRSVIADGVSVGAGEKFEDAVVVSASLVAGMSRPAKALKGHVIGDKFVVPLSQ